MTLIADLTQQNEALSAVVGQSETDRTKLSERSDQQLTELKAALADAVTESRTKSVELESLSATMEALTCDLDASKVVLILYCHHRQFSCSFYCGLKLAFWKLTDNETHALYKRVFIDCLTDQLTNDRPTD